MQHFHTGLDLTCGYADNTNTLRGREWTSLKVFFLSYRVTVTRKKYFPKRKPKLDKMKMMKIHKVCVLFGVISWNVPGNEATGRKN